MIKTSTETSNLSSLVLNLRRSVLQYQLDLINRGDYREWACDLADDMDYKNSSPHEVTRIVKDFLTCRIQEIDDSLLETN